jgi:hypothetical protein
MGTDVRRARQPCWSSENACEQPARLPSPPYDASICTSRADMPRPWFRRSRFGTLGYLSVLLILFLAIPTSAVFIEFQNCLSDAVQTNSPLQLQFVPMYVDAKFNTTGPSNNLQVTVWGNVTGSGPEQFVILPAPNDTGYWDSNQTNLGGKILDEPDPNAAAPKLTTLLNKVDVLTYEPWSDSVDFCSQLINASCPLAPSFYANGSAPHATPFVLTCH